MERIEGKIDSIAKDVGEIKVTLAVNTESLKLHMKRSDLLEAYVNKEIEPLKADLESRKVLSETRKMLVSKIYTLAKIAAAIATVLVAMHAFKII